jgi:hypothetical protein
MFPKDRPELAQASIYLQAADICLAYRAVVFSLAHHFPCASAADLVAAGLKRHNLAHAHALGAPAAGQGIFNLFDQLGETAGLVGILLDELSLDLVLFLGEEDEAKGVALVDGAQGGQPDVVSVLEGAGPRVADAGVVDEDAVAGVADEQVGGDQHLSLGDAEMLP